MVMFRRGPVALQFAAFFFAASIPAAEDPFEALLDLDYARQVWMPSQAPLSPFDARPGFPTLRAPQADVLPPLSATATYDYRNLIRKQGSFAYDHAADVGAVEAASGIVPGLELRAAGERENRELGMSDADAGADARDTRWNWKGSVTYMLTPWVVPSVTVGGDSRDGGDELAIMSLRGKAGLLEWAAATGDASKEFPVTLRLRDYQPLSLPLHARRRFEDLGLRVNFGPWQAGWYGRFTRILYPGVQPDGYALSDSGYSRRHDAELAFHKASDGTDWRAALALRLGYGEHAFRGINDKGGALYAFSYEKAEHKAYSLRGDLEARRGAWRAGAWLGGGELEWDALRPDVAYDKHFWDRNGIIDSYEGPLLSVFDDETWLFNGAFYLAQWGGGAWAQRAARGWTLRGALGYQRLRLESSSHLTKRQTSFLLAYREESSDRDYPAITADIVTPELRVEKNWGGFFLAAEAAQAIPVSVRLEKKAAAGGSAAESSPPKASEYSGGTRARAEIGWTLR